MRGHSGESDAVTDQSDPQLRILRAAEEIIASMGVEAATTRAVATAAGVQAPTIYRLFGDKDGLLDAVAEHAMKGYAAEKGTRATLADPVEDMRAGWDAHVAFGLSHPGIFAIMTARIGAPRDTPAMRQGLAILSAKIKALAAAGRLRLPEQRALNLFHAAATGTILTLLRQPVPTRDMGLSTAAREAAIWALTGDADGGGLAGDTRPAIALKARLPNLGMLSDGERLLLSELLDRIATSG